MWAMSNCCILGGKMSEISSISPVCLHPNCPPITMRLLALLLVGIWATIAVQGLYDGSSDVVALTPSNYKAKLSARPALVEFYAPW